MENSFYLDKRKFNLIKNRIFLLKIDKFQTINAELKSVASSRMYLVNYFDEIRNSIDIECQSFLNNPDATTESNQTTNR